MLLSYVHRNDVRNVFFYEIEHALPRPAEAVTFYHECTRDLHAAAIYHAHVLVAVSLDDAPIKPVSVGSNSQTSHDKPPYTIHTGYTKLLSSASPN